MAFLHVPLEFLGMMLRGRIAMAGILGFALAYILIGYGLLRLRPKARLAGIVLFGLFGLNGLIFSFLPGTHAKMLDAMKETPYYSQRIPQQAPPPMPYAFRLLAIPVIGIPLWFLITRKNAFKYPEHAGPSPLS